MVNSASTKKIVLFIVLLTICIFITDYFFPLGVAVGLPYVAVVLLSLWLAKKEYTLFLGVIVTVLTILGFFISPPKVDLWIVITNRTSALFGVWACVYFVIKYKEILKAHLKEKEKSELYLDIAPSIFLILDKHHIVQKINRRGCEILGYEKEEIQGKDWYKNFIPKDEIKRISETYLQIIEDQVDLDANYECHVTCKNGERRLISWKNEVLLDKEGEVTSTLSVGIDITEEKKATDSLQKEKVKAQQYLDLSGVIFVALDKEGNITMINNSGCKILGHECGLDNGKCVLHDDGICRMEGKNWFDNFVPKEERSDVRDIFQKLMSGEAQPEEFYENEILCKDGSLRTVSWHNNTLKDDKGDIIGTLSSGMDITRQKNAEEKLILLNKELEQKVKERTLVLEESQQMHSMIAHNFPNGEINVFDKNLNYVFVEGMELFKKGITGDMLIGTSFLERIDPEIRDDLERKILSVFKGENISFELETEEKTYLINAVGMKKIGNKINHILMVSQNITSLKNAEKDIQKALEKEQHLNEFKTRFVSMTSHEFRTPLTGIMNAASLLSKYIGTEGTEEKQQKHINRIKGAVVSLTTILNDFLSMDKLEEGKIVLQNSEFNFTEFCNKKLGFVANMTKIGQQIEYHHKGSTIINTDSKMLGLIMNNLLSNAIKYSPENSTIKCDTVVENKILTITVSDKGIGIPKDEQNQLFSLFFRAKNAHNIQGTGLGLNIVKKYLDVAGGEISCESDFNKGSAFTIKIPLTN